MIAWTIYISFIGSLLLMLWPSLASRPARVIALLTALAGLALALAGAVECERGTVNGQLWEIANAAWIPQLGIHYHLAADGISVTLVLLTGIAAVAAFCFRGTSKAGPRNSLRSILD